MKISINNLQSIVLGREKKMAADMVAIYVCWIKAGRMANENVLEQWCEDVRKAMED